MATCSRHSQKLQVQVLWLHCPEDILGHPAEKPISFGMMKIGRRLSQQNRQEDLLSSGLNLCR